MRNNYKYKSLNVRNPEHLCLNVQLLLQFEGTKTGGTDECLSPGFDAAILPGDARDWSSNETNEVVCWIDTFLTALIFISSWSREEEVCDLPTCLAYVSFELIFTNGGNVPDPFCCVARESLLTIGFLMSVKFIGQWQKHPNTSNFSKIKNTINACLLSPTVIKSNETLEYFSRHDYAKHLKKRNVIIIMIWDLLFARILKNV